MEYLQRHRNGKYYYYRRVPTRYKEFDRRRFIRIALRTSDKYQALKAAIIQNDAIEAYWIGMQQNCVYAQDQYKGAVDRAKLLGFSYQPLAQIAQFPVSQLFERLEAVEKTKYHPRHTEAILGSIDQPKVKLSNCINHYIDYTKNKTLNKSPDQVRKWKTPRVKAIKNLIHCIGNKPLQEITREDTLKFRDWWIERIDKENITSNTANKDLIYTKTIIDTVSDNLRLNVDTAHLFKKLVLIHDDSRQRLPFETKYITSMLLNPENLAQLPTQARCALMAIAETGAGIAEQVGLLPEDIVLDHPIPHISIVPRNKRMLKTKYRRRTIPLVGYALEAFKECPEGFFEYRNCPDRLSSILSHYLRGRKLLPTPQHTVYSLRHSFQDRLLAVNAPDRVQADLMGHKFSRQAYGSGASLEQKLDWLLKIQLSII